MAESEKGIPITSALPDEVLENGTTKFGLHLHYLFAERPGNRLDQSGRCGRRLLLVNGVLETMDEDKSVDLGLMLDEGIDGIDAGGEETGRFRSVLQLDWIAFFGTSHHNVMKFRIPATNQVLYVWDGIEQSGGDRCLDVQVFSNAETGNQQSGKKRIRTGLRSGHF